MGELHFVPHSVSQNDSVVNTKTETLQGDTHCDSANMLTWYVALSRVICFSLYK